MLQHTNYCKPPSRRLAKYAASLYARIHERQWVKREIIQLNGWQPAQNHCHANSMILETYGEGFSAVHGWLYLDYDYTADFVRFIAHSVVTNQQGQLIDITPYAAEARHFPFITSELSNPEYEAVLNALIKKYGATNCLDHLTKA
jgi:hypothetical protein